MSTHDVQECRVKVFGLTKVDDPIFNLAWGVPEFATQWQIELFQGILTTTGLHGELGHRGPDGVWVREQDWLEHGERASQRSMMSSGLI